jgi:hypothetical protein
VLFVVNTSEFGFECCATLLAELKPRENANSWKIAVSASEAEDSRWNELAKSAPTLRLSTCKIRPLSLQEALNFVELCLETHPDLLSTPDARLLIAYFGLGNPGRISALLDCLISAARARRARLFTTWEVWAIQFAAPDAGDTAAPTEDDRPMHPENWPTPRVLEILNQCRKQCGIPPRPHSQ